MVFEYDHLDLMLWDGSCCTSNCSHMCNSTFRFCLQEAECTVGGGCPCTHGLISTDHFPLNVSSVAFAVGEKLVDNISNPLVFDVMQWKVSCFVRWSLFTLSKFIKGTLRMTIEVRNRAGFNVYDLIDQVHIKENLEISTSLTSPSYYIGIRQRVRLRLSFRVLCSKDCASPSANCSIYCHSNSNGGEHSAVNVIGASECLQNAVASGTGCKSPSNFIRTKRGKWIILNELQNKWFWKSTCISWCGMTDITILASEISLTH